MIARELIEKLQAFDSDTTVVGTWEGVLRELDVYQAADGRIMVDADNNFYKDHWQNLKCVVCGAPANGRLRDAPMCYKHMEEHYED